MFIIGITGGTGAGKSSAVKSLQELGAQLLDCDVIYHELLSSNTGMINEIYVYFNDIKTNGKIDRRKLAKIVWENPKALDELNRITHKYVDNEINKRIKDLKSRGTKIVAIDAIALIESGQDKKCDIVVGIISSIETRLSRIISRDGLTEEQALKRIKAQQSESFYRDNCQYILENQYETQAEFEKKCIEFFKEIIL